MLRGSGVGFAELGPLELSLTEGEAAMAWFHGRKIFSVDDYL